MPQRLSDTAFRSENHVIAHHDAHDMWASYNNSHVTGLHRHGDAEGARPGLLQKLTVAQMLPTFCGYVMERDTLDSTVTRQVWTVGLRFTDGAETFLSTSLTRSSLGLVQPPMRCVPGRLQSGQRRITHLQLEPRLTTLYFSSAICPHGVVLC